MKYIFFTAKDFVKDSYFQKWVLDSDEHTDAFWQTLLMEYPYKRPDIEEAIEIITALGFKDNFEANHAFVEVWDNILAEQNGCETSVTHHNTKLTRFLWLKQTHKLAAVFIGLLVLSCSLFLLIRNQYTTKVSYATNYGETNTIVLPDSSEVTLNANSSIYYTSIWGEEQPREVWLKGEAYFKILKKSDNGNAKFKVHTKELTVEVLGTTFNVSSRRDNTKVALNTGKVSIDVRERVLKQKVFMEPGEFVEYSERKHTITKRKVDPAFYSSWKDNKLMFDRTPLRDIAMVLKDNYGMNLVFEDASLANKKFTGMVPANEVGLLISTLKKLYDLDIANQNNEIILSSSS